MSDHHSSNPSPPQREASEGALAIRTGNVSEPLLDGKSNDHPNGGGDYQAASATHTQGVPVGFFTQYTSTLRRQLIQKRRMPCAWLTEILLPVVFVLGVILVSFAVTKSDYSANQFITTNNTLTSLGPDIRSSMCYINGSTTIDGGLKSILNACPFTSRVNATSVGAQCMPEAVFGIVNATAHDICVTAFDVYTFVARDNSGGFEEQMGILGFDDMVLLQLFVRVIAGGPPVGLFDLNSIPVSLRISGYLYFTPRSPAVAELIDTLRANHQLLDLVYGGTYGSSSEVTSMIPEGETWGIVDVDEPSNGLSLLISLNSSAVPSSVRFRPRFEQGGLDPLRYSQYWASGFLTLQQTIYEAILNKNGAISPAAAATTPVFDKSFLGLAPMGFTEYTKNTFLIIAGNIAPLMLVLAYLYPVSQVAKRFVEEKELRLREGTMIMGLGKSAFFCSWLTIYHIQTILLSVLIAILLKATVMPGSDWFLIFLTFALFGMGTVHLSAMLATFFSSSKVTALVVPLLYFAMSIPSFAIPDGTAEAAYPLLSLLCPVPFSVGLKLMFGYEINNGMGWGDVGSKTDTPMNMGGVLGFFVFDIVIYTVLMLYLDLVVPKQWGSTYHPCFCCTMCCKKKECDEDDEAKSAAENQSRPWLSKNSHLVQRQLEQDRAKGNHKTTSDNVNDVVVDTVQEYPLPITQATVHIKRLMKVFDAPTGVKHKNVAVNKFDMCLYPNTITVLLGHNGAGKTTVMNMITGMLNMSSGDVVVYGDSVRGDLQAVRRKIGYCPQHNILWDDLTCIEHLEYFGRLKGMSGKDLDAEVQLLLSDVDLTEKANNRSHELSGGQKRKLSVAIAFMGGSNLVLLDEPTAGMDVGARRHTWELLKEMSSKNNRTVLMTTHFMDEADLLGSRIAIMSKGELESYGTSTFLKNRLGTGYVLKISSTEAFSGPEGILGVVHRTIPVAEVKECKGQELTIALPKSHIREFAGVIRLLESSEMRRTHKISTISMSVSTLEDVFVQLALDEELRGGDSDEVADSDTVAVPVSGNTEWLQTLERVYTKQLERAQRVAAGGVAASEEQSASSAFIRQLTGLIMKRANHAKRDYRTLFLQIVLPLIVIVLAMALGELGPPDIGRIDFTGSMYGTAQMTVMNGCDPSIVTSLPGYSRIDTSNISTYDTSVELVATANSHGGYERYSSVSCNQPGSIQGVRGTETGQSTFTTMFVNGSGYHQAPLTLNQLYAASIRQVRGDSAIPMNLAAQAMPRTTRQEAQIAGISSIIVTIFVLIPFTFIPSTYVGYAVKEKETKSKHLQFVSGVHYLAYWLANLIFDTLCFLITMAVALAVFAVFGRDEFVGGTAETFFATLVLLLFYGISGITSAYAISFLFNNHSTAQNMVMFGNFIAGFMLVLVVYLLSALSESGKSVTDVLKWIFRFIPSYCLGNGLLQLSAAKSSFEVDHVRVNPFGPDGIGYDIAYMGILSLVYFLLVLFIDNPSTPALLSKLRFWQAKDAVAPGGGASSTLSNASREMVSQDGLNDEERKLIDEGEDEDVSKERSIIRKGTRADDAVRVNRIRKVYGNGKVAVRSLTFGVKKGEVFGFLGTNGAGKTTTMSMLTGEFTPTSGGAMVGAFNVVENARDAQRIIGYCPQFDAVMDLMTPFEHLSLYASLRLVPAGQETSELIDALLVACDLVKYRDIPAGNLSGGNKRKLSIAIALVGGPQVVFLDEPTAGIDPAARRQLFDVISFIAKQSAVVLTTHHLEEVDVLAHRVGIMDRGAMKCLGSLERLKAKYGDGIEVTLQASDEGVLADNVKKAKRFMETTFRQAKLSEERQQRLLYVLPFTSIKLSDLFETVMKAVDSGDHGIKDYTVQQSSLEQVFLRISRIDELDGGPNAAPDNISMVSDFPLPDEEHPIQLPIQGQQNARAAQRRMSTDSGTGSSPVSPTL